MSSSVLTQELQVASAAGNTTDARTAAIANGDIVVGAVTPVDWTLKMTAVKDQKSCGSCWAFTAVGLIEAGLRIKYGSVYNFAEQELVDCCLSTLTSVCYVGSGCQGGNSEQALNYVSKWGIAATSAYPYAARLGSCRNSSTSRYKVVNSAAPVSYVARLSASSLQNSIAKKPTAIYVDASSWQWYFSGIFTGCIYTGLNHAVIAVGYDASGNWKIRNSWGPLWGEAGHIRIAAVGNPCGVLSFPFTTTVV
jgi:cathepsin L